MLLPFIKKECYHIFRDKRTLLILFGMPILMILLFGYAIRNDMSSSTMAVVDEAHNPDSRRFIAQLDASAFFQVTTVAENEKRLEQLFKHDRIQVGVILPGDFERRSPGTDPAPIRVVADGSDPNTATSVVQYIQSIFQQFQNRGQVHSVFPLQIIPEMRMLYNPGLKSVYGFVPGLMALILMLVSAMMTAITITREKETGTMEVLLVSPLRPLQIIVGKITPYILLSFINALVILSVGYFLFHVPVRGSLWLLLSECLLFILTALSLGILISTVSHNQQMAMMIALGGLLMPTVLLSGFIFPLESMPEVLQWVANVFPAKWFILILKRIMLMGTGWNQVWFETLVLAVMCILFIALSIKQFKIRLQ